MKSAFKSDSPGRALQSSVVYIQLMFERTITTTNSGGTDRYVLTDADFPPGYAIQDVEFYAVVKSSNNISYKFSIEGMVEPGQVVVAYTAINANNDGYKTGLASTRADFAVHTQVVLEVSSTAAGLGVAGFTAGVAVRIFT